MRFVWWTLRTVVSSVVPLGVFFTIQKCKPLVDLAYHMVNRGTNPYPISSKGGLAAFLYRYDRRSSSPYRGSSGLTAL